MAHRPETIIKQARERIARIRDTLGEIDYLCSGTLLQRTKVCGKPGCRCASDPDARHGPYFEWGHMKGGKLVHRTVSPAQAAIWRSASPTIARRRSSCRTGSRRRNGSLMHKRRANHRPWTRPIQNSLRPMSKPGEAPRPCQAQGVRHFNDTVRLTLSCLIDAN